MNSEDFEKAKATYDILEKNEIYQYRYMYLYQKNLVVEGDFRQLAEFYQQPDLIAVNGRILNEFIIEDLFANSNYKGAIGRAVGLYVQYNRIRNNEYDEQINELITLNNKLQNNGINLHEEFIKSESRIRGLNLKDRMIIREEGSYGNYTGYDYITYLTRYVYNISLEERFDKKAKKSHRLLTRYSINKIENDYLPVDGLNFLIKQLEKEDK